MFTQDTTRQALIRDGARDCACDIVFSLTRGPARVTLRVPGLPRRTLFAQVKTTLGEESYVDIAPTAPNHYSWSVRYSRAGADSPRAYWLHRSYTGTVDGIAAISQALLRYLADYSALCTAFRLSGMSSQQPIPYEAGSEVLAAIRQPPKIRATLGVPYIDQLNGQVERAWKWFESADRSRLPASALSSLASMTHSLPESRGSRAILLPALNTPFRNGSVIY